MNLTPRARRPRIGQTDRVAVIGLGDFGMSVATTLHQLGYDVTALDINERLVEAAADRVSLAAQGDGTDEELLRSLQVERSDVGVVAQAGNLEASILTTLLLKRIGVHWVVAKARTELHGEVLRRIGADRVIFPERDAGVRLAHSVAVPHIDDYFSLSATSGVAKFVAPRFFVGRTLHDLRAACGDRLSVLAIKRGQHLIASPSYAEAIGDGDELVVAGPDVEIEAFVENEPLPDEHG